MAGEDAFQVEGIVIEIVPNGTFRVELPNGHRLIGFVTSRSRNQVGELRVADKVRLKLSPYDLSEGQITEKITI
jgi:translation initiation factor IF-1